MSVGLERARTGRTAAETSNMGALIAIGIAGLDFVCCNGGGDEPVYAQSYFVDRWGGSPTTPSVARLPGGGTGSRQQASLGDPNPSRSKGQTHSRAAEELPLEKCGLMGAELRLL